VAAPAAMSMPAPPRFIHTAAEGLLSNREALDAPARGRSLRQTFSDQLARCVTRLPAPHAKVSVGCASINY